MANLKLESRAVQTDRVFREIVDKDRAAVAAKTEKLRALRLAKEAEDASTPPPEDAARKVVKRRRLHDA